MLIEIHDDVAVPQYQSIIGERCIIMRNTTRQISYYYFLLIFSQQIFSKDCYKSHRSYRTEALFTELITRIKEEQPTRGTKSFDECHTPHTTPYDIYDANVRSNDTAHHERCAPPRPYFSKRISFSSCFCCKKY